MTTVPLFAPRPSGPATPAPAQPKPKSIRIGRPPRLPLAERVFRAAGRAAIAGSLLMIGALVVSLGLAIIAGSMLSGAEIATWMTGVFSVLSLIGFIYQPTRRVRRPRTALAPAHAHHSLRVGGAQGRLRPGPASPVADRP